MRAGTGEVFEEFVVNMRQRIASDVFMAAYRLEQPFAVCRETFDELVRVGFINISGRWGSHEDVCQDLLS